MPSERWLRRDVEFEELVAQAEAQPLVGWDFSWLGGRASEQRPSWRYADGATQRVSASTAVLDVQTGGAEVFAEVLGRAAHIPPTVAATESWDRPPNDASAVSDLIYFFVGSVIVVIAAIVYAHFSR